MRDWTKITAPCYTERHHIIPRCAGGSNAADNLVVLTAEEHFVAHLLLVKIHKGAHLYYKMVCAASLMAANKSGGRNINSKRYGWVRRSKAMAQIGTKHSEETKHKMSATHTGRPKSDETKLRLSIAHKGKTLSDETKLKLSITSKGRKHSDETKRKMSMRRHSDETKRKMSTAQKVRITSDETKLKLSASVKNKPLTTCPHCGKEGRGNAMLQWHFDRCKQIQ